MLRTSSSDLEPQEALQAWTPIAMSVPEFKGTHSLGKSVPDSFSPKIQRTLASTVPPRPIVNFSFEDACEKLLQICADCEEAARLSSIEAVSPYVFRVRSMYVRKVLDLLKHKGVCMGIQLSQPHSVGVPSGISLLDLDEQPRRLI